MILTLAAIVTWMLWPRSLEGAFDATDPVSASVVIFEPAAKIFGVIPLSFTQWFVVIFLSLVPLISGEIGKLIFTKR